MAQISKLINPTVTSVGITTTGILGPIPSGGDRDAWCSIPGHLDAMSDTKAIVRTLTFTTTLIHIVPPPKHTIISDQPRDPLDLLPRITNPPSESPFSATETLSRTPFTWVVASGTNSICDDRKTSSSPSGAAAAENCPTITAETINAITVTPPITPTPAGSEACTCRKLTSILPAVLLPTTLLTTLVCVTVCKFRSRKSRHNMDLIPTPFTAFPLGGSSGSPGNSNNNQTVLVARRVKTRNGPMSHDIDGLNTELTTRDTNVVSTREVERRECHNHDRDPDASAPPSDGLDRENVEEMVRATVRAEVMNLMARFFVSSQPFGPPPEYGLEYNWRYNFEELLR